MLIHLVSITAYPARWIKDRLKAMPPTRNKVAVHPDQATNSLQGHRETIKQSHTRILTI